MHRFALLCFALATGCGPTGYYVSNVYATGNGLVVERCEVWGHRVRPENCHLEPVGALPGAVMMAPAPAGPSPTAPPPPAPPPPPGQDPFAPRQ